MFFNSNKGMIRLLNKGISNICFKVTIEEKNWRSQNFDILGFKDLSPGPFWGTTTHKGIIEFYNFLLQLKNHRSGYM